VTGLAPLTLHAAARWLERVEGMTQADAIAAAPLRYGEVCGKVLTPTICEAIKAGAAGVRIPPIWLMIEDRRIVTVLGEGQRPKNKTRRRAVEIAA